MKRHSISNRVFRYVLFSMVAVISIILMVQFYFLDDWYYNRKLNELEANTRQLAGEIEKIYNSTSYIEQIKRFGYADETDTLLYPVIGTFEEKNSATVNVDFSMMATTAMSMNINGDELEGEEIVTQNDSDILHNPRILTVQYKEEILYLYVYEEEWEQELVDVFAVGNSFYVFGFRDEAYNIFPYVINDKTTVPLGEYKSVEEFIIVEKQQLEKFRKENENKESTNQENGTIGNYIDGNVVVIATDEQTFQEFGYEEAYFESQDFTQLDTGIRYTVETEALTGVDVIVIEKEFHVNEEIGKIIVRASLQGIGEVMKFSVPFFVGFYIIAIIVAIIVAKLLSRKLTEPIVMLTKKTKRMSQLQFDEMIEINEKNELGDLGDSINILSKNLNTALQDLKKANKKLLHDIEKEREIESNRREFIANISHDIKTPLGIAKGYIEAVTDGIRKEKHDEYLQITLKELDRINQIVLNMMELMRAENTKLEITYKEERLEPYFKEMVEYFGIMCETKNMHIQIPETKVKVMIEDRTYKTILMNLLSNAIHYGTKNTDILVQIEESEKHVKVSIKNHIEYPEQLDIDRIWHKFYTMDKSRNRKTSGTGLGLPIVKSLLEQYESEFFARVEEDCFIFEFTLKKEM